MKTVNTTKTDTTFFIPARELLAAYCFAGNEKARYYLNGVKIDTGGVGMRLVGLDGHVAGVFELPDSAYVGKDCLTQDDGFLLEVDVTEKAFKAKTIGDLWVHGDINTGILQFVDGDGLARVGVCEFTRIDGTFPDWRRVMPANTEPKAYACFNPDMLLKFKKAQDMYGKGGFLRINPGAGNDPMAVEMSLVKAFRGVLMPVRWAA